MIILTLLGICTILSIYFYFKEHEKLSLSQTLSMKIENEYLPVKIKKNELEDSSNKYKHLQARYAANLKHLKNNDTKLSHYHLGVGTNDSTSYTSTASGNNLQQLEEELNKVTLDIKTMISKKIACVCHFGNDIQVNGKKSEAKKLFNREVKLRLRCLDNEFKSAAAIVDWYNINRIMQRSKDVFTEINASGTTVKTTITHGYLSLKLKEFQLGYEITQLKFDIKEEEREEKSLLREAEREEGKIKKAAEIVIKEREIMEELVKTELEKLESSTESQKELFEIHKKQLEELKQREQRAISLAQITRAGFVYIISNTMSFGKGICKIGMTRRADPNDRVKELGDASVPELFDVHAFAFTDDAPSLEKYLHKHFAEQRVNLVNGRKEFFYVEPNEVIIELNKYEEKVDIDFFEVGLNNQFHTSRDSHVVMDLNSITDNSIEVKPFEGADYHIEVTTQKQSIPDSSAKYIESKNEAIQALLFTFQNVIHKKSAEINAVQTVNINNATDQSGNEFITPPQKNKKNIPSDIQDIINTIISEKTEYIKRAIDKSLFDSYVENKNYKVAALKGKEIILKQRKKLTQ